MVALELNGWVGWSFGYWNDLTGEEHAAWAENMRLFQQLAQAPRVAMLDTDHIFWMELREALKCLWAEKRQRRAAEAPATAG